MVDVVAELRRSIHDEELGAVLRVRLPDGREVLCAGPDLPQRQVGARLHVRGYWEHRARRGLLFRAVDLERIDRPHEVSSVTAYLAHNIAGLGRTRARRLATVLGADALTTLANDPERVRSLFSGGTAEQIVLSLRKWAAEQRRDTATQRLTASLTAAGVRYGTLRRIVRFFNSADAAAVVTLRHPYRLVDVPGVGWATADDIAQRLGVRHDDPIRLRAACLVALGDARTDGHTGLPAGRLRTRAAKLSGVGPAHPVLTAAADALVADGAAVAVNGLIGHPDLIALEGEVADRIAGLLAAHEPLDVSARMVVERVLDVSPLSPTQRDAVRMALEGPCVAITGRPGAGKTTALHSVVECAQALGWRVQLVAPTGKAASRASEVTGVSASTVHRLLGGRPVDSPAPLDADLLVIDEASMCDLETAAWLLRAVAPTRRTRVVWCGDVDQLPSVGAGQVLADLIAANVLPTVRLTTVFRQAAASRIVQNAHRLLDGDPLLMDAAADWRFVPTSVYGDGSDSHVLAEVASLLAAGYAAGDIQVLAPMRRGPLGVEHLNRRLQELLNPRGQAGTYIGGGVRVRIGDRVVATRNIYDLPTPLFNGEQGVVHDVDRHGRITLHVGERAFVLAGVHPLMLRLAWAMTVHRAQGSEYPAVVLAYHHAAHARMLDPRVLYTGITRAKAVCVVVGTMEAIARTQAGASGRVRHTSLAWQLRALITNVKGAN